MKVVQIKWLAMHITNQKLCFDIFTVVNLQNILMEHDLITLIHFWPIKCNVGYCNKYTHATYDWFCAPGGHTFKQKSVIVHNITIFDRPCCAEHKCTIKTTQSAIDFSLRGSKLLCTEDVNAPVWGWAGVAPAAAGSTGSAGSAPPQTPWSAAARASSSAQEHQRPLYPGVYRALLITRTHRHKSITPTVCRDKHLPASASRSDGWGQTVALLKETWLF